MKDRLCKGLALGRTHLAPKYWAKEYSLEPPLANEVLRFMMWDNTRFKDKEGFILYPKYVSIIAENGKCSNVLTYTRTKDDVTEVLQGKFFTLEKFTNIRNLRHDRIEDGFRHTYRISGTKYFDTFFLEHTTPLNENDKDTGLPLEEVRVYAVRFKADEKNAVLQTYHIHNTAFRNIVDFYLYNKFTRISQLP